MVWLADRPRIYVINCDVLTRAAGWPLSFFVVFPPLGAGRVFGGLPPAPAVCLAGRAPGELLADA